jgi:hypothetical protein
VADVIRDEQPDTAPWHYVNIAPGAERYDRERDCADGRCVVEKIEEMKRVMVDPKREKTERVHALKWLVHLVGDVHQPLHCANAADRGGNSIHVTLDGERYNLHELWDSTVIERQHLDEGAYAKALLDEIRPEDVIAWQQGGAADWATETWNLARTVAYVDERGEAIVGRGQAHADVRDDARAGDRRAIEEGWSAARGAVERGVHGEAVKWPPASRVVVTATRSHCARQRRSLRDHREQLVLAEPDHHFVADDDRRRGARAERHQFVERRVVFGDVLVRERNAVLLQEFHRAVAGRATGLVVDDDVLGHGGAPPGGAVHSTRQRASHGARRS